MRETNLESGEFVALLPANRCDSGEDGWPPRTEGMTSGSESCLSSCRRMAKDFEATAADPTAPLDVSRGPLCVLGALALTPLPSRDLISAGLRGAHTSRQRHVLCSGRLSYQETLMYGLRGKFEQY